MSRFNNLRYCSADGFEAPVDPSNPDNPLTGQTETARRVFDARNRRIRWEFNGVPREFCPRYGWAALDPSSDLMVVSVGSEDLPWPNNGLVINPDGTTNHQIVVPRYVEKVVETWRPATLYLVEAIDSARQVNGRIAIDLNFSYEWIERRYYDPSTREWQERDSIYRK